MSAICLQTVMERHCNHEALCTQLDEELGTLHGLSWADFVLLAALDSESDMLSTPELAKKLGLSRSRVLLQLIPLEKVGLIERAAGEDGSRRITLRPVGRKMMREAWSTAADFCRALPEDTAMGK